MHKDLGHNFIDCVVKTYQSIVIYGFKSELFGNKGNLLLKCSGISLF